jgi:hypothetical protein
MNKSRFAQRSTPGMAFFDEEGRLVVDSGLASDTFNKIARARLQESEVFSQLVSFFKVGTIHVGVHRICRGTLD